MAKNVEFSGLTSRQKKMIAALLTSENIGQACELAGISRTTLARWLKDDKFSRELIQAEGESIKQASRELIAGQNEAIATIKQLMRHGRTEGIRLKAANDLLTWRSKTYDESLLEERLARLEKGK